MANETGLSRQDTLLFLREVRKHLRRQEQLTPGLAAELQELEGLIHNAELFAANLGVVDMGMINDIRKLMWSLNVVTGKIIPDEDAKPTIH